jgi:hypothetical protein
MLSILRLRRTTTPHPSDPAVFTLPAVPVATALAPSMPKRLRAVIGVSVTAVSVLTVLATRVDNASAGLPSGAGMVLNAPIVDVASTPDGKGYWEGASDGGVFSFGDAGFYGSTGSQHLNKPIVGMAATPDGKGYWEVATDGGIFAFGDAGFFGSTGGDLLNQPIVGMTPTPDGGGYWIVASDGGTFAFGDARYLGSATNLSPFSPIVGVASTSDGLGYWEAAADGAVFSFGDASYAGGANPGQPVVGISASGPGYRLVAADGGVFDFGGAVYDGSYGGHHLNRPMIGMASTTAGYLTVASDGGIFTFGSSGFYGSLGGSTVGSPAASVAGATGDGVTNFQRAAWDRVNMCEEGGVWNVNGPVYSGGLGFSHANWNQFNTFGYPANAANATPEQQIRVAVAFAVRYWGNPNAAPDQNGCSGGY